MGNQLFKNLDQPKNVILKLKSLIKTNSDRHQSIQNDEFIIKYIHNIQNNQKHINVNEIQQKRIVFISLIGLWKTWKNCPVIELFPAIFILPLNRKWIYYPSKYASEIKSSCMYPVLCNLFSNTRVSEIKEFIELLRWKDSQKLAGWMLNDFQPNHKRISPFWCDFNTLLTNCIDPITHHAYQPIMDESWFEDKNKYKSNYDASTIDILTEFYFGTMKYNSIKEIICQSNPNSLYPITSYHQEVESHNMTVLSNNEIFNLYGTVSDVDHLQINQRENKSWFISDDYDPHDI